MALERLRPDEGRTGMQRMGARASKTDVLTQLAGEFSRFSDNPGAQAALGTVRSVGGLTRGGDVPGILDMVLRNAIRGKQEPYRRIWATAREMARQGKIRPETAERAVEIELGPRGSTGRERAFIELLEQELPKFSMRASNASGNPSPAPGITSRIKQMLRLMAEGDTQSADAAMRSMPKSPN